MLPMKPMHSFPTDSPLRRDLVLDLPMLFSGCLFNYARKGSSGVAVDALWKGGLLGPGFDFSRGTSAKIQTKTIVTYPCSMELVITPSDLSNDQFIAAFPNVGDATTNPNCSIYIDSGNKELQVTATGTYRRACNISGWVVGETHHIIIVWYYAPTIDANNCHIYVDGLQVGEHGTDYWNYGAQTDGIYFGNRGVGTDDYTGVIDSIKVWDRALVLSEKLWSYTDPWRDYRINDMGFIVGGAASGEPSFNVSRALGSNQLL